MTENLKNITSQLIEKYIDILEENGEPNEAYKYLADNQRDIIVNYNDLLTQNNRLKKDAAYYLNKINELGHELIVITARSNKRTPNLENITISFIKDNNLPIKEVVFNAYPKSKECLLYGIDLMIDDNPLVCKDLIDNGINVLMFKNSFISNSEYRCASNWEEVYEYIKEVK